MPDKKVVFEVYALDVYQEDGEWIENERHSLGKLVVIPAFSRDIDADEILSAMTRFSYPDLCGCHLRALNATDRRRVYADDCHGDGTWWKIGTVKDRMPVYGLKLMESYNREERE